VAQIAPTFAVATKKMVLSAAAEIPVICDPAGAGTRALSVILPSIVWRTCTSVDRYLSGAVT
jgi:hypothetical protein